MAKFTFYQDTKQTIWQRSTFEVEAETIEEATELVKKTFEESGGEDAVGCGFEVDYETLFDTAENMSVEGNSGQPTIEIICPQVNKYVPIIHNGL